METTSPVQHWLDLLGPGSSRSEVEALLTRADLWSDDPLTDDPHLRDQLWDALTWDDGSRGDAFWDDALVALVLAPTMHGPPALRFWEWLARHPSVGPLALATLALRASTIRTGSLQLGWSRLALDCPDLPDRRVTLAVSEHLPVHGTSRQDLLLMARAAVERALATPAVTEAVVRLHRDGWAGTLDDLLATSELLSS